MQAFNKKKVVGFFILVLLGVIGIVGCDAAGDIFQQRNSFRVQISATQYLDILKKRDRYAFEWNGEKIMFRNPKYIMTKEDKEIPNELVRAEMHRAYYNFQGISLNAASHPVLFFETPFGRSKIIEYIDGYFYEIDTSDCQKNIYTENMKISYVDLLLNKNAKLDDIDNDVFDAYDRLFGRYYNHQSLISGLFTQYPNGFSIYNLRYPSPVINKEPPELAPEKEYSNYIAQNIPRLTEDRLVRLPEFLSRNLLIHSRPQLLEDKMLELEKQATMRPIVLVKEWEEGADNLSRLFKAISQNDVKQISKLLEGGQIKINERRPGGRTPLMHAAFCRNARIIRLLLENGADLECENINGETAFFYLFYGEKENEDKKIADCLDAMKGGNFLHQNRFGENCLMTAVATGNLPSAEHIMKLLAASNEADLARLLVQCNNINETILHYTIRVFDISPYNGGMAKNKRNGLRLLKQLDEFNRRHDISCCWNQADSLGSYPVELVWPDSIASDGLFDDEQLDEIRDILDLFHRNMKDFNAVKPDIIDKIIHYEGYSPAWVDVVDYIKKLK